MTHDHAERPTKTETNGASLAPGRRSVLRAIAALGLGGSALGSVAAQQSDDGEFVSLFEGSSLADSYWHQVNGQAEYSAQDGTITGSSVQGSPNSFLSYYKMFDDFELRLEVKLDQPLNSGIQIRSNTSAQKEHLHGPQVEIELSGDNQQIPPAEAGYVYGEALGTGWLSKDRPPHDVFDNDAWNDFRIRVEDDTINTWINDQPIEEDLDLSQYADVQHLVPWGVIGLQVHTVGETGRTVRWRNIQIKELDTDEWTSLFDGQNMDEWTNSTGQGSATVSDGTLELSGGESFFVHSDDTYDDFMFETWVKADAQGGLLFRNPSEDQADGYRADIDPTDGMMTGSLYDSASGNYLTDISGEAYSQMAFHPDQWNYLRVKAQGDDIRIWVNGITTVGAPPGLTDDAHAAGYLGLQHRGGDGTIQFRDMQVQPLEDETGGGGDTVSVPFGYDAGGGEIDGTVTIDGLDFVASSPAVTATANSNTGVNVGSTSADDPISGTENDDLYRTEVWGENLGYDIAIENGTYDVTLHFAEIYFGGEFNGNQIDGGTGSRLFDVSVEGEQVLSELDIFDQVGHDAALTETVEDVEVTDGTLTISTTTYAENSKFSGIEIRSADDTGGDLEQGLEAHFPLDGDTPTNTVTGNDATIQGGVTTGEPGIVGNAYEFHTNGETSTPYTATDAVVTEPLALNGESATVGAWVNVTDHEEYGRYYQVGGDPDGTPTDGWDTEFGGTDDTAIPQLWNGANTGRGGGGNAIAVAPETWHFVVTVVDGGDTRLHVFDQDGELDSSPQVWTGGSRSQSDAAPLILAAGDGREMAGRVDEVWGYSRALSASEVGQLHSQSLQEDDGDGPPPVVGDSQPTDTDGDGHYEDVNGDGEADYADVVDLFEHFNDDAVQDNTDAYDFNENSRMDFDDIVTLFESR